MRMRIGLCGFYGNKVPREVQIKRIITDGDGYWRSGDGKRARVGTDRSEDESRPTQSQL